MAPERKREKCHKAHERFYVLMCWRSDNQPAALAKALGGLMYFSTFAAECDKRRLVAHPANVGLNLEIWEYEVVAKRKVDDE